MRSSHSTWWLPWPTAFALAALLAGMSRGEEGTDGVSRLLEEADARDCEVGQRDQQAGDHDSGRAGLEFERPDSEEHEGHGKRRDDRGVDRAATLLRPVDVVEVHPQGELIDGQPDADSEGQSAELEPRTHREQGETQGSGDHHRDDAENEVMEVHAALADDAARPPRDLRAAHQSRADPDEDERPEKADEDQEQSLTPVLHQLLLPEVGEYRGA